MDEKNSLHELTIKNGELALDGLKIKGLIGYELKKNSASSPAELSITLQVKDLHVS